MNGSQSDGWGGDRDELARLSLVEAARLVSAGRVSAVELTRAVLAVIDRLDGHLHAYLAVDHEKALQAAATADHEISREGIRGPLHGIPISVKDNFLTTEMATTAASAIYAGWIPDHNAAVVDKLAAAGAVLIGKTNMFELATGWGTTGYFPLAVNPWDAARSPGGSSSGSAVAVAASMGFASIGTDGGGSVRVPANYCGVTGLKPTFGQISCYGTIPTGPSVTHVGVLARSGRDAAIVASELIGYDSRDPRSANPSQPLRLDAEWTSEPTGTIGVPWKYIEGNADAQVHDAFMASLRVFEDAGWSIVDVDYLSSEEVASVWTTIVYAEIAAYHESRMAEDPAGFGPELLERLEAGLRTRAVDYCRAQEARANMRTQLTQTVAHVDLVATPTAPTAPPTLVQLTDRRSDLIGIGQLARFTRPYNLTGLPAITVPCGLTEDRLPVGLQLAGHLNSDKLVVAAADLYQRRTGWHRTAPPST